MKYPEFIKKGDTIGFVSPSFSCAIEPYKSAFLNSLRFWERNGFQVNLGPNTYKNDGVGICTNPKSCADELLLSYVNSRIGALISCGGGELMCETVSELDFEAIKNAKPKWFMGYSDNTNFTFLLTTICDVASIYAPCASEFGAEHLHPSVMDAYKLITGEKLTAHNYDFWEKESLKDEEHPLEGLNCTEKTTVLGFKRDTGSIKGYNKTNEIKLKGRLIGGCLDCLANLPGTRLDKVNDFIAKYKDDGIIWYLEACDLNVFSIRRAMWQLDEAGWFEGATGFIIGRPLNGDDMMGLDKYDAVLPYTLIKHNAPTIMDADIGHLSPMMPLINGALSEIIFNDGNLKIDMGLEML